MSKTADTYFKRYAWPVRLFPEWIPDKETRICIILPAFQETNIIQSLESIDHCTNPGSKVILLIIVNEPANSTESAQQITRQTIADIKSFKPSKAWLTIKYSYQALPQKKAGVGLARKIGMDEAAFWFTRLNQNGIIVCFDADSTCASNYLMEVSKAFELNDRKACISYYEHPMNESSGIISYELHLRYYSNALRYAGYPNAFQTLGSCISIDTETYIRSGGMNTRKAGEDFYFLHKVAEKFKIQEVNSTIIFPSDRLSDRVPFGTGKALQGYQDSKTLLTYSLRSFLELKQVFENETFITQGKTEYLSGTMRSFVQSQGFEAAFGKMRNQAGNNPDKIKSLFWHWWNGFRVLKFIHFYRDKGENMISPVTAIQQLNDVYWKSTIPNEPAALLDWIRAKDRNYSK